MWFEFSLTSIFIFAVLIIPGYCFLRAVGVERAWSFCAASLVTPGFTVMAGILFSLIGLRSTWLNVLVFSGLICFIVFVLRIALSRATRKRTALDALHFSGQKWILALYVIIGCVLGVYIFVWSLDTPLSFSQNFDNGFHLNAIRAFYESGNWSILTSSKYPIGIDRQLSPLGSIGGFYPAAFHLVCVMAMDAFGVATAMAENAALFVFSSIVFPLSMLLLFDYLFEGERRSLCVGAVVVLAFAAFPWGLIVWGPVYPNMAAYTVFPVALLLGIKIVDEIVNGQIPAMLFSVFLFGVFSLVVLQPNTFFFGFICLFGYIAQKAFVYKKDETSIEKRLLRLGIVVAIAIILWTLLFMAPPFQGVLAENWLASLSKKRALFNVFIIKFTQYPAQLLLALVVLLGIFVSLRKGKHQWIVALYALFCFMYFLDMSTEGFLKHYLSGFWYTDYNRIAACAVIVGIPLAVLGLNYFIERMCAAIQHDGRASVAVTLVISVLFTVINYFPTISLGEEAVVKTPIGTAQEYIHDLNNKEKRNQYGQDEIDFVDKVMLAIPENALVLNVPDDGSIYAYGINGLRTYYRDYRTYSNVEHTNNSSETERSIVIREHIGEVATNIEVQKALKEIDCHYLLLLDRTHSMATQEHLFSYDEALWTHFQMIDDDTPGFDLILQDGDMRLYYISAID